MVMVMVRVRVRVRVRIRVRVNLDRDEARHRVGDEAEELGAGAGLGGVRDGELHALDRPDLAVALERQAQHAEVGAAQVKRIEVAALRAGHALVDKGGQHAHAAGEVRDRLSTACSGSSPAAHACALGAGRVVGGRVAC